MHIYNMIMGLSPMRGARAPTCLETKSAHAWKALLMGCDLVYVTSGFKTPTMLRKKHQHGILAPKKLARNCTAIVP